MPFLMKIRKNALHPDGTKVKIATDKGAWYILGNTFDEDQGEGTHYYVSKTPKPAGKKISFRDNRSYDHFVPWDQIVAVLEQPKKQGKKMQQKLSKSKILPYGTKVKTRGGRILYILGNTFDDDRGDDTNYYVAKTMPKQGVSYIHHYTDMILWTDVAEILLSPKKKGKTMPKKKSTSPRMYPAGKMQGVSYYTKKTKGKNPRTLFYQEIDGVKERINKKVYEARLQKELKKAQAMIGKMQVIVPAKQALSKRKSGLREMLDSIPDQSFQMFLELEKQFAYEQIQKELKKIIKIGRNPLTRKKLSKQDLEVLSRVKKSFRAWMQTFGSK